MRQEFRRIGGDTAVEALDMASARIPNSLSMSVAERRRRRIGQEAFWFLPTKNTRDRHDAAPPVRAARRSRPRFLRRLSDRGARVLPPAAGEASPGALPRLQRVHGRAVSSVRRSHHPGLRVIMMGGLIRRPIPALADEHPEASQFVEWYDVIGIDSEHDYDPVWAKCRELKIAPSFHNGARSILLRNSPSNFCYNHIGHCEKRHRNAHENTNPARLDHAALLALAEKYGQRLLLQAVQRGEGLDGNGNGTGGVEDLDDYSCCQITRKEDIRDLFVPRYYFGCEADDPLNAWAFNGKANPMGARLNALFSSDIGHFDVPDMTEVVPEAYELVEDGLLDVDDFRDFMFANAVRFWGEVNPDFFKGTVVEKQAAEVLGRKAC